MTWVGEISGNGSGLWFVTSEDVRQIPTGAEGTFLGIEDGYPKFITPTGIQGPQGPQGPAGSGTATANIAMNLIWIGW